MKKVVILTEEEYDDLKVYEEALKEMLTNLKELLVNNKEREVIEYIKEKLDIE